MASFKNLYRIPSARLQNWDYARAAWYFVTVCTKGQACFFGEIVEGEVVLSPTGRIVAEEWEKTPQVRPSVALDQWQIMPNHLHAILVIKDVETPRWGVSREETFQRNVSTGDVETARRAVSARGTHRRALARTPRLKPASLGSIIGQFKSACTRRIWAAGFPDFAWQPRFYDHIIRSQDSLAKIRDYIIHNPLMWGTEEDRIENLRL